MWSAYGRADRVSDTFCCFLVRGAKGTDGAWMIARLAAGDHTHFRARPMSLLAQVVLSPPQTHMSAGKLARLPARPTIS